MNNKNRYELMQLRIDLDELRISSKANATIETGCPLPICKNLTIDSEGTRVRDNRVLYDIKRRRMKRKDEEAAQNFLEHMRQNLKTANL